MNEIIPKSQELRDTLKLEKLTNPDIEDYFILFKLFCEIIRFRILEWLIHKWT